MIRKTKINNTNNKKVLKQSLRDDIKGLLIYEKMIFMYNRPFVKETCMNVIKLPLRYWLIGRSLLIKKHIWLRVLT